MFSKSGVYVATRGSIHTIPVLRYVHMKTRKLAFAIIVYFFTSVIYADGVPVSRFGPDDTIGAINLLSPKKVLEAAKLIKTGKTYALGMVTGRDTPAYPPRTYDIVILQPGDGKGATQGSNLLTANDDILRTWIGIGSQLDGLAHIGVDHVYYNQAKAEDIVATTGMLKYGTHDVPPIVTRGVLLDMTAIFGKPMLNEGEVFNTPHIKKAMKRQAVNITEGDVVLFHTGWHSLLGKDNTRFGAGEPGLGNEGAEFLSSLNVVAVGADTWGLEVVPMEDPNLVFPVHQTFLPRNGIYILENMVTAPLVADKVWEFLFVLGQPRLEGSVQAIINPIAIH